ncbi:MAG: aldo/keto reductase [Anaerolineae bacterium]|nr:aldo/keto reductase [Anaerolineae bacterium]
METRRIGSLKVSVVGLGCNNFGRRLDAARTAEVVHACLDNGINFFDTADVYGGGQSEDYIGKALKESGRRNEAVIASKFGNPMEGQGHGAHPDYIRTAVEASLRRLQTDHIDLYQLHVPDPEVPVADTLGALDDLVKAGKVREIGCSNFSAQQVREAQEAVKPGAARFVSVQNRYSVLHREPEYGVLDECERHGLTFLPYFPLESGLLTGKVHQGRAPEGTRLAETAAANRFLTEQNVAQAEQLTQFAEKRGHTILELAFGWLLARPVVASVIAGATKPEQVKANAGAAGWTLTDADLAEVEAIVSEPA